MTKEEYQAAVRAAALCAHMLKQWDLPALLEAIERADAFGGFVDPTLWMQKRGAMAEDKALLEAALPLWRMAEKLEPPPGGLAQGSGG